MTSIDHIRVPKAGELVASQLRRQIVRGELVAGTMLPTEAILMQRFGVSRPTLREAIRMLEADGLITVIRGSRGGARVQVPDPASLARQAGAVLQHRHASLKDVYDIRTLLETQAAGMAARSRTPEKIARLEELLAAEERAVEGEHDAFLAADEALHLGVVGLAGSTTLELLVRMLYAVVESANIASSLSSPAPQAELAIRVRTHRSHAKLVRLVREGTAEEVEQYWNRHLRSVSEYLLSDIPAESVVDLMS
ncbi:GntR family transcriptional regulator [Frankia canadensis]|uniref:GntR family transcriptional regulator n=1 Tax=Frankia canadensis TaxID=1836972 RepID=A0A2I2KMW9_9ACTN|nr:GntR family transcriptional regulator [Frankia canadensis]SNQ47006.1 GntR family transcriptional regulator [Frankia canadensis]SOU54296.1 GntR family transcriptional regulator [Frankia canadensis]